MAKQGKKQSQKWEQPPGSALDAGRIIHVFFRGKDYTIAKEDVDDVELFELIEDGKSITACRQILGSERWAQFKEDARDPHTGKVKMETFNDFLNEVMSGIARARREPAGNSSASPS